MSRDNTLPLCVDLDGTLIKTDSLFEGLIVLLEERPIALLSMPFRLFGGKAYFKQFLADRVALKPELLPYNEPFLEFLRREKESGRHLVLSTAANEKFAAQIANYLGIFSEVIASDSATNLSGNMKLRRLEERFGHRKFVYAGNGRVDIPIWRKAHAAIVVNPHWRVERALEKSTVVSERFETRRSGFLTYLRAVRIHQWLKNLLVFVPVVAGHRLELLPVTEAAIAFLAFSLCASSGYLLNDMVDLTVDRSHPSKHERPLAAGDLSLKQGGLLAVMMLVGGFGLALLLPTLFGLLLISYFLSTMAYSLFLKKIVIVDVLTLAGLYTLRVIAGGAATTITLSFWLLAFSMFLFLSLALIKRCAELSALGDQSTGPAGRGYAYSDLEQLRSMGIAAGYLSVLVIALYVNSDDVTVLYRYPQVLWLVCPLLLYWVSRLWLKTGRGEMHHDPLVFAVRDPISQLVGALMVTVLLMAT